MSERIKTFAEFYQYYLTEHSKTGTRIFHFIGTFLVFFVIEKNKPATFRYPLWSLISDFRLFFELLIGKQKFTGNENKPEESQKL